MLRFGLAILAVVLSSFGTMMVIHNVNRSSDAFGIGIGVGCLVGGALALIEFVKRR
jgi:hypothetical protein